MFQMTPYQSWTTFIVLVLLVAAVVWLIRQTHKRHAWNRAERSAQQRRSQMAIVTDLPASKYERHLTLVTDISRHTPEPALYDWRTQGI